MLEDHRRELEKEEFANAAEEEKLAAGECLWELQCTAEELLHAADKRVEVHC